MAAETDSLAACVRQLERTAAWLRSLPLARFSHDGGAVERQARALIAQVNASVAAACAAATRTLHANARADADCPPAGAVPDVLAVHALGDQLAVHCADLARCGRACQSAGVALDNVELDALADSALRLRSGA